MFADIVEILLRAIVAVGAIILLTRGNGLRTFSKMSSFDFAVTVAFGSVIASSVISQTEPVIYGVAALAGLVVVQRLLAISRVGWPRAQAALDNPPVIVMENGVILHENLKGARMTETDLYARLREANVRDLASVQAVVMETTGDVSVLHGESEIDEAILTGVTR